MLVETPYYLAAGKEVPRTPVVPAQSAGLEATTFEPVIEKVKAPLKQPTTKQKFPHSSSSHLRQLHALVIAIELHITIVPFSVRGNASATS